MIRLDFNMNEIQVQVAADNRRGVWASTVFGKNAKSIRTAGSLPTQASSHTLLLVALTTSLRNITKAQHSYMISTMGAKKPRVQVVTGDQSFADAMRGLLARDVTAKPLRAGRNFLSVAAQQFARFDVSFVVDEEPSFRTLVTWANKHVIDPKMIRDVNVHPALTASVASQVAAG